MKSFLKFLKTLSVSALSSVALVAGAPSFAVEGPPQSNGVISNPVLVENQDVAKAQAVGIITSFMGTGAQTCDDQGKNCRSVFGNDDTPDYATLSSISQGLAGVSSFNYRGADGRSESVATQTGSLAIACGDKKVHTISGVAFKALSCFVNTTGDVQMQFQVCSAPMRSNPVEQPKNAVACSMDPSAPNYKAPIGFVCMRPACDTEPVDSLDGWSSPMVLSWDANLSESASESAKTNNGMGMVFYPPLNGGVTPSYSADSDNLTIVKIVQSAINSDLNVSAVGLKIAYRHKAQVTKEMLTQGASAVPNPGQHTGQWENVVKLAGNALVPQYQEQYAQYGTEHLQEIQQSLSTDGIVRVYDENYQNESGVRPIALSAQLAAEGQNCGTTFKCLQEVTNTNTWTQTCEVDTPMSMRSCDTTTPYTMEDIHSFRSRSTDVCTEKRLTATYSCQTSSVLVGVTPNVCAPGTVLVDSFGPNSCSYCNDNYQYYKLTCAANDSVRIEWWTSLPNGKRYSLIVDKTIQVKPFVSSVSYLGPFCGDGSGNVPLDIACSGTQCRYTTWITGNCNGAITGARAAGLATVNYRGEYRTINQCSGYEAAK